MRIVAVLLALTCGQILVGCEAVKEALEACYGDTVVPVDCNPLAYETDCMLPYPSDYFLVDDATLPSGKRVFYPTTARPMSAKGQGITLRRLPADGFSMQAHIIALFPEGLDPTSIEAAAYVIEADTGHRPRVLVELDPRADDPARQALVIRPLEPLRAGARYVVAFAGLRGTDGTLVKPPTGFAQTIADDAPCDSVLAGLWTRYRIRVFPVLEKVGLTPAELQLAWDFTVRTQQNATQDMLDVRRQMLEVVQATPPVATVTEVSEPEGPEIGRKVVGTIEVPLFLDKPEAGALLNRGPDGRPVANGTAQVPFTINIPQSVLDGGPAAPAARLFQYGHGFFGEREEVMWSYCNGFAQEFSVVFGAVDWWGMDGTDRQVLADLLFNDPTETLVFVERVHQGIANQLAFTRALKTSLTELDELKVDGKLVYDPDQVYFHGLSQGHILGGTTFALSPELERAALGVGGAGFTHMMMRSVNFSEFLLLINNTTTDALEQTKLIATTATDIDRWDPLTYASMVFDDPLPDAPTRQLLIQVGLGDAQVPNLTARLHARALNIPLLTPTPEAVAGLETTTTPQNAAYVEADFGVPSPRPGDLALPPQADNEVHEALRRTTAARAQLDGFLKPDGVIVHTCEGACDPE
ncbi:MAG: hypothetical protein ACI9WU_003282 [Myxococcota bacterium]|jgi:hypothetical protein